MSPRQPGVLRHDTAIEDGYRSVKKPSISPYWPRALRLSWLLIVLCFMLGLIATLEVLSHQLPMDQRSQPFDLQRMREELDDLMGQGSSSPSIDRRSPQTGVPPGRPAGADSTAYLPGRVTRIVVPGLSISDTPASSISAFEMQATDSSTHYSSASTDAYIPGSFSTATAAYITPTPSATNPAAYVDIAKTNEHVVILDWPKWKIFVGNYLPVMLAVLLKMFWTPIVFNANLMQPFIAMSRPAGAPAHVGLFTGYLSHQINPLTLFRNSDWLALAAEVNSIVITLIAPLSSEAIFLDTRYDCENPDLTSNNPCMPPRISVDRYIVRILQGLLALASVVLICIMVVTKHLPRPVLRTDPSTIAAISILVHHPVIMDDIKSSDASTSTRDLVCGLPNRQLSLQHYMTNDGRWRFGIAPVAGADYGPVVEQRKFEYSAGDTRQHPLYPKRSTRSLRDTVMLVATAVLALGILGVIIAYYFDGSDDPFNRFFNSDTFGPRFVLTSLATFVSVAFDFLQQDVVLAAPFQRLSQGVQSASSTLLLAKSSLPILSTFTFLRHMYIFPAFFSFTAALGDVLVILAAVVPYSPGRVWLEFLISSYTCMCILALMFLCCVGLAFWRRRVVLARKPDTIGAVASYFCGSNLVDEIDSYRDRSIKFTFDPVTDTDGVKRWTINAVLPFEQCK